MSTVEKALVKRVSKKELSRWVEENAIAFQELMAYYRTALTETEARVSRLREELTLKNESDPVVSVRPELKAADAVVDAMLNEQKQMTAENVEKAIDDIAAITVVCMFPTALYQLADALTGEDGVTVLKREDWVEAPGEDGYRALHLLLAVPVTLRGQTRQMKVEVRLRTGVMQLWSDVRERLAQEKDLIAPEQVRRELRACAELGAELDARLGQIRYNIDHRVITK
ncbi:MAG: hypothetical protein E7474_14120 [Ruminococcaceae bacterium]|nr:hypothetical protein [Oscillospiraceae bacterium]